MSSYRKYSSMFIKLKSNVALMKRNDMTFLRAKTTILSIELNMKKCAANVITTNEFV